MDVIRKQLGLLIGANQIGETQDVKLKYYNRDVCGLFLSGLWPHDLFELTGIEERPKGASITIGYLSSYNVYLEKMTNWMHQKFAMLKMIWVLMFVMISFLIVIYSLK